MDHSVCNAGECCPTSSVHRVCNLPSCSFVVRCALLDHCANWKGHSCIILFANGAAAPKCEMRCIHRTLHDGFARRPIRAMAQRIRAEGSHPKNPRCKPFLRRTPYETLKRPWSSPRTTFSAYLDHSFGRLRGVGGVGREGGEGVRSKVFRSTVKHRHRHRSKADCRNSSSLS